MMYYRKRNRLFNYDYSGYGYYFITICVKDKKNYFGAVSNDKMILNEIGKIVKKQWISLEERYQYTKLDEHSIMPNHLHGIVIIDPSINFNQKQNVKIKSLSEIIGAFKTMSSKAIHMSGITGFSWQRSFYDRIIRNEQELCNVRAYIKNNPLKWELEKDST